MNDKKSQQAARIQNYARLIEQASGKAIRPYRADGYVNLMNRYGTSKDTTEHYNFVPEPDVPDDSLTLLYEGNGLFSKIIDAPAEEAIKHGFKLDDISDQEVETFYQEALDELDWEEVAMTGIKWARLFGGAIAVMLINDGGGLEEPLNWKRIKSIDDIRVYDRSVIQPDYSTMFSYDPRNPFSTRGSRLGMPEFYHVNSRFGSFTVHESRCLIFQNGVLPENSSNTIYQLWGMPEYVRIHRAMRDAELAHSSGPKMLDRSVQPVYKMKDLAALLATEEGESQVLKRLQVIDLARGLLNSLVIDNEGEDYDFKTFQYTGVADVVDGTCNFLSAITNIPQTILFGRSPAGMNATGDSDLENWYSYCGRIQKRMVKSNLRYLLSIIFQAGVYTGEVDEVPKIKVAFNPLKVLSDSEQAELDNKKASTALIKAQTVQIYRDMEVIDSIEIRKKLADSGEFEIDTILDEYEDEEELLAAYTGQEVAPGFTGSLAESGDFDQYASGEKGGPGKILTKDKLHQYGTGVDVDKHETDPGTKGSAPANAPAATKLPQDMSKEEQEEAKDGETAQEYASRRWKEINTDEAPYGVGVLIVKDGRILCGTRHNDTGYGLICGPGGHGEKGETPEQSAFRETEEEFGISPKELIPIGIGPFEPESGLRSHIFLCTDFDGEPDCVDLEMTNPKFRTMEELEELKPSLFPPFADSLEILKDCLFNENEDGGPGSGNHGHKGVPGQVGGSAPKESGKKSKVKSKVSIDTIKQNHYTPIEQEALRNPAIAMGVLIASGEVNAQEYVELMKNGKAVDRAKEYIEKKYSALGKRYNSCPDAQKRMMEMTTKEFKEYVDAAYNKEIDSHLNTKSKLQHIIAESGMDMKPKVVGVEEFEKIAAESPSGKMYRGVVGNTKAGATAEDVVNLTVNGEKTFVGDGMHSDGIYFSTVKATADSYAANGGKVMTACVSPDARVIWYNDLMKMKGDHVSDPNLVSMDTGVFALYKGYNCIELEPVSGDRYYVALDRSALVFCDEHSDANEKDTSTIDGAALAETFNAFAQIEENVDGGPGSGNHGHEGRPGEIGGSLPNGGDADLASMPMSKGAEVVDKFGVGTTVKITKRNGKQIEFTKIGDDQWKRADQPEYTYQNVGVAGNCWKAEVEVIAKKSEKPEERREIAEGVEKAEEKAEKKAEETEAKEAPKPTGKYAQLSDKVDAVKKSDMTKAEKADAYKQMVKEAEPGTTFKCAGIEYRKTEDPDYPLAMIDFEGKAFRHVRDVDWDIEFSADKDDCIKFFDKDAIVAGRKETVAKMKKSGKFSTSDQVHAERPGKITLNSENFGEAGDYVVYRNGSIGSSGMIFFSPKKEGADSYSFAHGGSNTGEYEVHLEKPLVIRGETDVECIKKAYETLHPGKAVKGPMTSAKWISCDKANASALNSGTDGYDSVVYIINGKPSEVQVSAKKAKKSVKKTGEYTVAEWSKSGHTYEEAAARGYIDETAEDYKRVDSVDDGFGEDGVHCSQNKYDEILRRAND